MSLYISTIFAIKLPIDKANGDLSIYNNPINLSRVLADITRELSHFFDLETVINAINDDSEKMSLYIEISGLLREMDCPYPVLMEGFLDSRYTSTESIILILRFLLSELLAVKILSKTDSNNSLLKCSKNHQNNFEHNLQAIMNPALATLGLGSFSENIDIKSLFSNIGASTKEKFSKLPKYFLGQSLISSKRNLTHSQWNTVENMINNLNSDYTFRRQTLIQRLDVCVQSFMWCPKATEQKEKIVNKYKPLRSKIQECVNVTLVDLLSARSYPYTLIHITSSGESRESSTCKLNKHMIGPVPDRGGRTGEMEAPPPEMPAFQKRDATSAPSHQNRGRGRGDGGQNYNHHPQQETGWGGSRGSGSHSNVSTRVGSAGGGNSSYGERSFQDGRTVTVGNYNNYNYQQTERYSQNVGQDNCTNNFSGDYAPVFQNNTGYGGGGSGNYGYDNNANYGDSQRYHNNTKNNRGYSRGYVANRRN